MWRCGQCGNNNPEGNQYCAKCGQPRPQYPDGAGNAYQAPKKSLLPILVGLMLLAGGILIGMFFVQVFGGDQKVDNTLSAAVTQQPAATVTATATAAPVYTVTPTVPVRTVAPTATPYSARTVQVSYITADGPFAQTTVTVSPANNVITPDASMVPSGYSPVVTGPVTIAFDNNGAPNPATVVFLYQAPARVNARSVMARWSVPGERVIFGSYEQDNNTANGKEPVEWIVLDTNQAGQALLMSRYALDMQRFNSEWIKISWQDCSLRTWLNGTFYQSCFNLHQQKAILSSSVVSRYVDRDVQTYDKVFCLSAAEAKRYLSKNLLLCTPTSYASARPVAKKNGYCYWWLRDTTNRKNDANRVDYEGIIEEYGANTNASGVGVRPVIWVDVDKMLNP